MNIVKKGMGVNVYVNTLAPKEISWSYFYLIENGVPQEKPNNGRGSCGPGPFWPNHVKIF